MGIHPIWRMTDMLHMSASNLLIMRFRTAVRAPADQALLADHQGSLLDIEASQDITRLGEIAPHPQAFEEVNRVV
jgi:hypothetical protein